MRVSAHAALVSLYKDLLGKYHLKRCGPAIGYRTPFYGDEPIMSPHIFLKKDLSAGPIESLERKMAQYGPKALYLNVALELKDARSPLDRRLAALGYKFSQELRTNVYTKTKPFLLPAGFSALIGDFLDKKIFPVYADITHRCFPGAERYTKNNRLLTQRLTYPVKTALIFDPKGRPAATASVMCSKNSALLFGGAVLPAFRKKGIWKSLVALRQVIAAGYGISACTLFTANSHILESGDSAYRFITYRK